LDFFINKKHSTSISLGAGSSQCVVNKEYLDYLKTEPKPIKMVTLGFCRKKDFLT